MLVYSPRGVLAAVEMGEDGDLGYGGRTWRGLGWVIMGLMKGVAVAVALGWVMGDHSPECTGC